MTKDAKLEGYLQATREFLNASRRQQKKIEDKPTADSLDLLSTCLDNVIFVFESLNEKKEVNVTPKDIKIEKR